ncbi:MULTISPECIES: hypothetical protein [unclassified Ruegeria]|uniref:hypothetical protein n=1 Tax=unclassified Ruegeria TaxID=2625375 RepID=UPI0014818A07|nr:MULTISPECIES: hypothetical protein [unclassified Ruegeria]NOD37030.1 hypothetical protein [Ruegeria sp. HKCCD7296]NOE44174.1 hypothetical protein [Ruegeria sp. HKCCD7319]
MSNYSKIGLAVFVATAVAGCVETTQPGSGDGEAVARANCVADVNSTVGVTGSSVNDVTRLDDGFSLLMNVPGAQNFWVCETTPSGAVTSVFFMGEG